MIDLPNTTYIYRRMPREMFLKHLNGSDTLKKTFQDEIESIIWMNILTPETMAIPAGENIAEIAIVEVVFKRQAISRQLLEILNRETPRQTVFVAHYEEWGQIWCCCKETGRHLERAFPAGTCYQTSWMPYRDLDLNVKGGDLDQVYENFLIQIAGKPLQAENRVAPEDALDQEAPAAGNAMKEPEDPNKQDDPNDLQTLAAAIKTLEAQIDGETQFRQQLKLVEELERLKEEMKKIKTPRMVHVEVVQGETENMTQVNIEAIRGFFPNIVMEMKDNNSNRFDFTLL